MAGDSAITVNVLTANAVKTHTGAVSVLSSTASGTIDVSTMDGSKLLIFIDRDSGSAKNPTIIIEDGGSTSNPLWHTGSAVGNITKLTTAAGEYAMVLETNRFKDSAGLINITKDSTDTVVCLVSGILLP